MGQEGTNSRVGAEKSSSLAIGIDLAIAEVGRRQQGRITRLIEPDVLWRAQRVIVEADGRDPHLAPLTFASDRRRDRRVRVEGWVPVRVTSEDLDKGADELERDLRSLLGAPPPE